MDDGVEQQTERIDENMPLLALDQLACIEAMRIDAGPLVWGLGCQELKHGANLFSFFYPLARWWRASHRPTPIDPASQAAAADGLPLERNTTRGGARFDWQ
jgi:hypothetical protein